jgi:hypothetical protein
MRIFRWMIFGLIAGACTGSLSDEQRKKLRENMEDGEIRKVTDAELTEASFAYGRTLATLIEKRDKTLTDRPFLDSLEQAYHVQVLPLAAGDSLLRDIEKQIIEAYTSGAGELQLTDNIQKLGTDSMLYTKPIMRERPDGSLEFARALGIRMPNKYIIRSIQD